MLGRKLYTAYAFFIFGLTFVLAFPLFLIPIFFPRQFRLTGKINRWWAILFFRLILKPYSVEVRGHHDPNNQYIYCPNHFSYLDIPTMGFTPTDAIFLGKSSLQKVPLFGWMYSRLHITVNRSSQKSRGNSLKQSIEALEQGKNLIIFPEGGILTKNPPHMIPFKDGAFRAALEKKVYIVPVTIPFNWKIFPDDILLLHKGKSKVIFHEPISTAHLSLDDTPLLKQQVFDILDRELKRHNNAS